MPFSNKFGNFEGMKCGLMHIINDLPVPVPLRNVNLNVKVVDFIAQVIIEQDYVNKESNAIEVSYSFPVEESAAITNFNASIDGHEIEGEVKKRQEAKADYDRAMFEGNSAILLEETAPDIFSMKLGQLKAGSGAKIKLTYIMELPVEEKAIKLTVPTTIAPRYIPSSDNSEAAKEIAKLSYNSENEGKVPLSIHIQSVMQGKIKKIFSPSHNLTSQIEPNPDENGQFLAKTGLENAATDIMNRDLIVLIESENNEKPVVFVEKDKDSTAALISLIPSFKLEDQKVELIFLVDRSGSMQGPSIQEAKKALQLFLHSMPADCYFNIWSFGSRFTSLFEQSKAYDDSTLEKAKKHVAKMNADLGGTEVFRPLEAIFKERTIEGHAKQIFLLTDGAVSNDNAVIDLVKKNSNSCRLFTLGLGSSASRHLVKGVARAGNGTSIFSSLNEDLRPKVMTLLKNSLMPSLTNVKVSWNKDSDQKMISSSASTVRSLLGFGKPSETTKDDKNEDYEPGVLFDGTRMLHFKIFNEKDLQEPLEKVIVSAQAPDGPLSIEIPISKESYLNHGQLVHQMAARKRIQDLEEKLSNYFNANHNDIKEEIIELSLKFHIASTHTSFVGVDKDTRKTILEPAMRSRQVHQEIPQGFGQSYCFMAPPPQCSDSNVSRAAPMAMCRSSAPIGPLRSSLKKRSGGMMDRCASIPRSLMAPGSVMSFGAEKTSVDMSIDAEESDDDFGMFIDGDDLSKLIQLQMANGSFKYGQILTNLTGFSEAVLKQKCPENVKLDIWMTCIATILMQDKFEKNKDMWELVAEKARKFVKLNCDKTFEDLSKIVAKEVPTK